MANIRRYEDYFFTPFENLRREIEKLFDEFGFGLTRSRTVESIVPTVDVYETDNAIMVEVEIPGVDKKDIHLKLEDNILTISAEKKFEEDKKDKNFFMRERFYGKFERSLRLPDYIDPEKIKAKYENGILRIEIPKKEEVKTKAKEIEIE